MKKLIILFTIMAVSFSCKQNESPETTTKKVRVRKEPKTTSYTLENTKQWLETNATDNAKMRIALALNRTDKENFTQMDSVIIPADFSGDLEFYLPFPTHIASIEAVDKLIYFSYPTQTFAAYEYGELIYTGPTSMGRKKDMTPTGLFYTNWKAEETTSTFDDEWDLKWNFNVENKLGVGWHQYSLPGYPASHSCLRLQETDARYLYDWADQWVLADEENVKVKGTPVIVFGSYDFDAPKPWLQLVANSKALNISENEIEGITKPFLSEILSEQKNRLSTKTSK
ncbi:L,D-transpeptidase [Flavobacterium degerlachei]|jgi:lipoprotein-anchoring transpeptidase ErfK/SrfK|uniref:L,D-transpeptidase catalytic domain n=1 Tax=Flavobacterium degerlachei TaxID=229203 RepID=A0A1H3GC04_9FLAO|nr:L,D-transpeptidase [Flavobacterium degerlachei]SDY00801.1 L,D-transpeptidase catalytic domain [Flavobacterium degerlachei]